MHDSINALCAPLLQDIHTIVSDPASTADPSKPLKKLAVIFQNTNPKAEATLEQHPCLKAVLDTWSVVRIALARYQTSADRVESCNNVLKWALRCVKQHLAPHIGEIMVDEGNLFAVWHASAIW